MSTWKIGKKIDIGENVADTIRVVDRRKRPPAPPIDVLSLEIDNDTDSGGDPYNRTGQFATPDFDAWDD